MKSRIILIASLSLFVCFGTLAQGAFYNLDFDAQKSDISIVDIDADGDRDILIIGENPDKRLAQLYLNDGNFSFTPSDSPFAAAALTTMDWGDVDGDGNLDAVQSGFAADSIVTNLFRSNAEGTFSVDNALGDFQHMSPSLGMADLNNDGYTDVYVFGNHFEGKPQLYFNDKEGGFTVEAQFDDYEFIDPQVSEVDIDNDGDIDFFVMAGYEAGMDARFARIFINDNGEFTETDPEITAKGFGHAEWGDYDSDGDMDLLLNGDGWVNSGEDNDHIVRLYENTDGELSEATTFTTYRQSNVGDGTRFADWDNDGDLDIIITGWNEDAGRQATSIYLNDSGNYTALEENESLPGVSESAVEVGDLDNDGDLDLVIGGYSGNNFDGEGSAFNKNVSLVIENTTAGTNEAPSAPANLTATATGRNVTFSWDEASDDKTASESLTYNFFLVSAEGQYFYYPLADTATGYLRVQEKGNVQLNNEWTIKGLPYGEYQWGVQAIDNSFAGSTFATASFNHREGGPLSVLNAGGKPLVYPNPVTGPIYVRITPDLVDFSVISIDGKLIRSQRVEKQVSDVQLNLKVGIYLVKARYADGRLTTDKIIVK